MASGGGSRNSRPPLHHLSSYPSHALSPSLPPRSLSSPVPVPISIPSPSLSSADRRALDKVVRRLEKLGRLCDNARLALRNSPPYLPELMHETLSHLRLVWGTPRRERGGGGGEEEWEYLRAHLGQLQEKSNKAILLFKEGREKMYDESSSYRRNLTKLSLIFSHSLAEFQALFPGGQFQGDTYRLAKSEAGEFWRKAFGNKVRVPWEQFKQQLRTVHSFQEGMEAVALRSTLDLTCSDHVSIFQFDIFTRLFQPWSNLLRNWDQLAVTHPGYMAFQTYDQVKERLERHRHRPGSYIFRLSCTRLGQWAIGHVTHDGTVVQTIPHNSPLYNALIQGQREGLYLYPDGRDFNPDLSSLYQPVTPSRIQVTEEQYALYCDMGSSFQLCKICTERDKSVRLQPCAHLLCLPCLHAWQKSDGHSCPFCRCEIRGTEQITIDPYEPPPPHRQGAREEGKEDEDEDEDEEDLEDVELVMQKVALMKASSLTESSNSPSLAPPSLPPRPNSPAPPTLPPRPSVSDMLRKYSNFRTGLNNSSTERERLAVDRHWDERSSSEEDNSGGSTHSQFTASGISSTESQRPPGSQDSRNSSVPWQQGARDEREEWTAVLLSEGYSRAEVDKALSISPQDLDLARDILHSFAGARL
ncbi:E3 ubiquitin-protein ligase CBL-C [Amia ocellicauda]|uniref:E3 ubiquitin-protein ligase CBL-C n=1 Tax=Amia ocellicauda TaxID=2972642 RepID=UPI003464DCBD